MKDITVFEENLFYIIEKIQGLRKCLNYDLDKNLVSQKVHEDIVFIFNFLLEIDKKMKSLKNPTVTTSQQRILLRAYSNAQTLIQDSIKIKPSFFLEKTQSMFNEEFLKVIETKINEIKNYIYANKPNLEKNIYISQDELTMLLNP